MTMSRFTIPSNIRTWPAPGCFWNGALQPLEPNALKHVLDREEIEGLKLLLAAGADPNETNDRGETALHWAVWRGRSEEIVRLLLAGGANLNTKRNDGRTA